MQEDEGLTPDGDRLGMVTAAVLLAFALTRVLPAPELTLTLQLPGFYFAVPLTIGAAITLLAAGLTASGMNWILRGHPSLSGHSTRQHWLLPTLTTLVTGITLTVIPTLSAWWIGFGVTAGIMLLVFMAEYIVVEPAAPYYPAARAGLTALSFALFLILTAALRLAGTRMVVLVPAIFLASGWSVSMTVMPMAMKSSKAQLLDPQEWNMTGILNARARSTNCWWRGRMCLRKSSRLTIGPSCVPRSSPSHIISILPIAFSSILP